MRVVFAGTPEFASAALERLIHAGYDVPLVLTQPDRPAGRGMKLQASPVKLTALQHGVPVAQPLSLRLDGKYPQDAEQARAALLAAQPDVMVVAAYGLILPQWVLDLPHLGCLNIHASLLPRWRGAAPIHRAIEAGDTHTGITIMQMDAGLDTGAMCLHQALAIGARDTTASLHDRLADMGAELIVQALQQAQAGTLTATPQPAEGVTYAHKIEKHEAWLDWRLSAEQLDRRLRAFTPFPGGAMQYGDDVIKVWAAQPEAAADVQAAPGTVLQASAAGVLVACGSGALRLTQLQRAGGKRLGADDFLRGFALPVGSRLHSAAHPAHDV